MGRARRGHKGTSRASQQGAHASPPEHTGLRARAHRGQGHTAPSAGVPGLQRGLRRRPDGGSRSALDRGPDGMPFARHVDQQHSLPRSRKAHNTSDPGHSSRTLLPDQGRGVGACGRGEPRFLHPRGGFRLRGARDGPAREGDGQNRRKGARDHGRKDSHVRGRSRGGSLRACQQADDQAGDRGPCGQLFSDIRGQEHRAARRQPKDSGIPVLDQVRRLDLDSGHDNSRVQEGASRKRAAGGDKGPEPVFPGTDNRRGEIQQGDRHLGEDQRRRGPGDDEEHLLRNRRNRQRRGGGTEFEPHIHDDRLGSQGKSDPGEAACRNEGSHGQAVGGDHRDSHHFQFPRRPLGAPVLHLHPRSQEGTGGHRPQDRKRRLSHQKADRRVPGRHDNGA